MTAEIAILNRIGVALAADSAVTIGSMNKDAKVYNSADKLFRISDTEPVGVMVHGSSEFMGMPAETIVKGFRSSSRHNKPQKTIDEYATRFTEFVKDEVPTSPADKARRLSAIVVERLARLRSLAEEEYERHQASGSGRIQRPEIFVGRTALEKVRQSIGYLKGKEDHPNLEADDVPAQLGLIVRHAVTRVFGEGMNSAVFEELFDLLVAKNEPVGGEIGFVFAGFGTDQRFPAINAVGFDVALASRVKPKPLYDERISTTPGAIIKPFAQSEMIDRFMDGVDNDYTDFVQGALDQMLVRFGNHVADRLGAPGGKKGKALAQEFDILRKEVVGEFARVADNYRRNAFRRDILNVVEFMPKTDLAEMAESLVNLTSIKRRVSAERETVGGPIDVAVISKYDGFVWVRRKAGDEAPIKRTSLEPDAQDNLL